jgi:hypothetical protein
MLTCFLHLPPCWQALEHELDAAVLRSAASTQQGGSEESSALALSLGLGGDGGRGGRGGDGRVRQAVLLARQLLAAEGRLEGAARELAEARAEAADLANQVSALLDIATR